MKQNPESSHVFPERIQEPRNPEFNGIAHPVFEKIFRLLGRTTRPSVIPSTRSSDTPVERPLSEREERARLYHALTAERKFKNRDSKNRDTEHISALRKKAHDLDELSRQSLHQGTVKVEMGEMGTITARFTILKGSELHEETEPKKPTVVFIPGIANDIECVDTLGREIAASGRDVVVIGYPGSFMGEVTSEFADASEKDSGYGPHREFFHESIKQILPADVDIELWGFSTGAPMIAEMLSRDAQLAARTSKAVLVNPASSVSMPKPDRSTLRGKLSLDPLMQTGIAKEAMSFLDPHIPGYTLTMGRAEGVTPEAPGQRKIKERLFEILLDRIRRPSPDWKNMRVKEGGEIVLVTSEKDPLTQCYKAFNAHTPLPNAQMTRVIEMEGRHQAPLLHPEFVVEAVEGQGEK